MDVNFFTSLLNRILLGKHLDDLAISSVTINEAEINFVYIIGKNTKDKYNKVRLRCLAKLKRNNLKKCFVIYLDVNKKMKLKGIQLDCIYDYEIKSRNQKQLEDLSEKYYLIRKKSMLRNLNLRELPDDILCPCGSGKKYILCCKAKEKQK